MISSARQIYEHVDRVRTSAKSEPENLGHRVTVMASYFDPLADGAVGVASLLNDSKRQTHLLDLTKTVIESSLQFMYSCKEGGGNKNVSGNMLSPFLCVLLCFRESLTMSPLRKMGDIVYVRVSLSLQL